MSVSMKPGATALTVMLRVASSRARALVKPIRPGLGRGIVHLAGIADRADHRADIDDAPAPLLEHAPQADLGETEHRGEIDVQRLLPFLALHAQNQRITCDAGVVDQDRRQTFPPIERSHHSLGAGCPRHDRPSRARGSRPASHALIASAPASVVAVPTTVAPARPRARAMACPIPRDAPVTSARSCSNMTAPRARWPLSRPGWRHRSSSAAGAPSRARNAPLQAGQHLARATFDQRLGTPCAQRLHGLRPAHRAGQLAHQRRADVRGLGVRLGIHRADVEAARCTGGTSRDRAPAARLPRASDSNAPARSPAAVTARLAPRRLASSIARSTAPMAGDHHLPGRVVIHRLDHLAGRRFAQAASTAASSSPRIAAIAPPPSGTARLHQLAAVAHQCHGLRERERAGAHQRRELAQAVPGDHAGAAPPCSRQAARSPRPRPALPAGCIRWR